MGGATSSGPGGNSSGNATMPDLFKMTREQAAQAVQEAGFARELEIESAECGSVERGVIVERGEVCMQRPFPGVTQSARLAVAVTLQDQDPRRGGSGDREWRLMPKLAGLTLDQARAAMRAAGFEGGARVTLYRIDEPGCRPDVICRSNPSELSRGYLSTNVHVYMGRDPAASAPTPRPDVEPSPLPPADLPAVPPPPKDAVPEPFF